MDKIEKKSFMGFGIIGVVLLTIVVGATYAYFSVETTNNFGTQTIEPSADEVGSVVLSKVTNGLSMSVSASDMMRQDNSIKYCATASGKTTCSNDSDGWITIAKIDLTGEGIYECDYTLGISASGTTNMYQAFQAMSDQETAEDNDSNAYKTSNQLYLQILGGVVGNSSNPRTYDFINSNLFTITERGKLYISSSMNASTPIYSNYAALRDDIDTNGLTGQNAKMYEGYHILKTIEAGLFLVNDNTIDQTALAGTDITLTFSISNFNCTAISDETANTLIQALLAN